MIGIRPESETFLSNRFEAGFLMPQEPNLQRLYELEEDLVAERAAWQASGAAEQLLERYVGVLDRYQVTHPYHSPKYREGLLTGIRIRIYGNVDYDPKALPRLIELHKNAPSKLIDEIEQVTDEETDYCYKFKDAVRNEADQRNVVSSFLLEAWQEFMFTHPNNLGEFCLFLQDEEFQLLREKHRPFLETLERRADNLLKTAVDGIVERASSNPPLDLFRAFIEQIVDLQGKYHRNDRQQPLLEWLRLVSHPSSDIDPEALLAKIAQGAPFPKDLRNLFIKFVTDPLELQRYQASYLLHRSFRQPPPSTFKLELSAISLRKGNRIETVPVFNPKITDEVLTPQDNLSYKLALGNKEVPTEKELALFIEKTAHSFAGGDQRMRKDIEAIIQSLTLDPFGLGVAKLTVMKVTSQDGRRRLPLRRFRPDQRIQLEHPESSKIRVVYYLDRRGAPDTVLLHEILHHDEFDAKYT